MSRRSCLAIVLAAGDGTRMRSGTPKVLHVIGGRTLLGHVLHAVLKAGGSDIAVVAAPEQGAVAVEARRIAPKAKIFAQRERKGTAHAVLAARNAIARKPDDVLVIFGDTPLIRAETLGALRRALSEGAAVAVLGFRAANPTGYGRLITQGSELVAIREEQEASEAERSLDFCNAGLMALAGKSALAILGKIGNKNAKREYYLTDAVGIAQE